jgi:MYXO-CTERM domain-containing protein
LVAAWDFQTTSNGGTAAAAAPNSPKVYVANFGSGTIYLDGTNSSSNWAAATELSAFAGTALNASGGMSTTTSGAASLALLGGTANSANGKSLVFKFSMTGLANLAVSYATQKTNTGFATQTWDYSTDGSNWFSAGSVASIPTAFAVQTLGTVTGLNGAATAYLRLTVTGATSASGNNRLDNIVLNADAVPAPGAIALIGLAGLASRRRR